MLSSSAILMLILERTKELQAACLVLKFKTTFPDSCPTEPQSYTLFDPLLIESSGMDPEAMS